MVPPVYNMSTFCLSIAVVLLGSRGVMDWMPGYSSDTSALGARGQRGGDATLVFLEGGEGELIACCRFWC